jgi:hypothetical protein
MFFLYNDMAPIVILKATSLLERHNMDMSITSKITRILTTSNARSPLCVSPKMMCLLKNHHLICDRSLLDFDSIMIFKVTLFLNFLGTQEGLLELLFNYILV